MKKCTKCGLWKESDGFKYQFRDICKACSDEYEQPEWKPSGIDLEEQRICNEAVDSGLEFETDADWLEYLKRKINY